MATYGNYYRPRYDRMGDLVEPLAAGVGLAPSVAPPPPDPVTPVDKGYLAGTPGAVPGSPMRMTTMRQDAAAPAGVRLSKTTGQTAAPTTTTSPTGTPSRSYQGGPLAYYGTGDIAGADRIQRGTAGVLTGFNEGGWGTSERGVNSIKNVNGRFFSRYEAKPSSIDLVLQDPDFRALFPNAKKVGFDKIDYGDGRPVDVLKNADPEKDSAEAWAWMPESGEVPEGAGTQAQADLDNGTIVIPPLEASPTSRLRDPGTGIAEMPYTGPSFRDWLRRERGML